MNYAIMIAAAFIIATIAIAAISPFENLPRPAPQEATATNEAPPPVNEDGDGYGGSEDYTGPSDDDDRYDEDASQDDGESSIDHSDWPEGEEPPP